MVVAISSVVLMFQVYLKRVMCREPPMVRRNLGTSASNRPAATAASQYSSNQRRRPRRTPSQISTKSLPPYMVTTNCTITGGFCPFFGARKIKAL
ncbi:hypothetical protein EDD15DRAFT_2262343, partial [Pisolithus albus]